MWISKETFKMISDNIGLIVCDIFLKQFVEAFFFKAIIIGFPGSMP